MLLNHYHSEAMRTKGFSSHVACGQLAYFGLKLAGESGEVSEKIGKLFRDHDGNIDEERRRDLLLELGDVLWYITGIAEELDASLTEVAAMNIAKLRDREARGVIRGSGDSR